MTSIIEFLNQPIVVTLITLFVGSYLLNVIADRRSRKDKLRDKAVEFLTETGNDMNSAISIMYGHLEGHDSESDSKLVEARTLLLEVLPEQGVVDQPANRGSRGRSGEGGEAREVNLREWPLS